MVTSAEMQATGQVRVRHGREHSYAACGFPFGGRMARTHWDERGRASISLRADLAASRVRSLRSIAATVARCRAALARGEV